MSGLDLYEQWRGTWSFTRTIQDHLKSETLHATGQATFTSKNENALLYREEGLFTTSSDKAEFFRHYLYVFAADQIEIYFADGISNGQLFQTLKLSNESGIFATDHHLCGADRYEGIYTFRHDHLEIKQHVAGPRKDYQMTTDYTKKDRRV